MRLLVVFLLFLSSELLADTSTFTLRIQTEPQDAKVRITSIKPLYYDGIKLRENSYRIDVAQKGFITKYGVIDLQSDHNITVTLVPHGKTDYNFRNITSSFWDRKIWQGKRSYKKNSEHTVKDQLTGLIWTKKASSKNMNHDSADKYCQDLLVDSFDDWRLPTYEELYYLADRKKYRPAIDDNYFDAFKHWYWSSTQHNKYKNQFWFVRSKDGGGLYDDELTLKHVRCVR